MDETESFGQPIITIFRSRLREGVEGAYEPVAQRMTELSEQSPGFIERKVFVADDGERVSIIAFADQATQAAWSNHPEHREAQRLGREEFYASYSIEVCQRQRVQRFPS